MHPNGQTIRKLNCRSTKQPGPACTYTDHHTIPQLSFDTQKDDTTSSISSFTLVQGMVLHFVIFIPSQQNDFSFTINQTLARNAWTAHNLNFFCKAFTFNQYQFSRKFPVMSITQNDNLVIDKQPTYSLLDTHPLYVFIIIFVQHNFLNLCNFCEDQAYERIWKSKM